MVYMIPPQHYPRVNSERFLSPDNTLLKIGAFSAISSLLFAQRSLFVKIISLPFIIAAATENSNKIPNPDARFRSELLSTIAMIGVQILTKPFGIIISTAATLLSLRLLASRFSNLTWSITYNPRNDNPCHEDPSISFQRAPYHTSYVFCDTNPLGASGATRVRFQNQQIPTMPFSLNPQGFRLRPGERHSVGSDTPEAAEEIGSTDVQREPSLRSPVDSSFFTQASRVRHGERHSVGTQHQSQTERHDLPPASFSRPQNGETQIGGFAGVLPTRADQSGGFNNTDDE
jgi:hypothetical protein